MMTKTLTRPLARDNAWRLIGSAAFLALFGAATLPAHAAAVTYNFAGNGEWSSDAQTSGFSGSFTYDSAATPAINNGTTETYAHAGASGWGMTLNFAGGASFTLDSSFNVNVSNNLGGWDRIGGLASDGTNSASFDLQDFTAALLSDVSLSALNSGLTLADFSWSDFFFEDGSDTFQGRLSAFDCVSGCVAGGGGGGDGGGGNPNPGGGGSGGGGGSDRNDVPEPASAALVLLALGAAGLQQRRRHSNGTCAKA